LVVGWLFGYLVVSLEVTSHTPMNDTPVVTKNYDMILLLYICQLQLGCHPVAEVQYTFTHKRYTERHKTNNT